MPYAIEPSVARPTIRTRLPARNPMGCSAGGPAASVSQAHLRSDSGALIVGDVHDQALARLGDAAGVEVVPAERVGQANAELGSDPRQRVAAPHDVGGRASLHWTRVGRGE